jgi:hypothetical protein
MKNWESPKSAKVSNRIETGKQPTYWYFKSRLVMTSEGGSVTVSRNSVL